MAQITKITVDYARTFNLGNFENLRLSCELTAELQPGDDQIAKVAELQTDAKEHVRAEYERFMEAAKLGDTANV